MAEVHGLACPPAVQNSKPAATTATEGGSGWNVALTYVKRNSGEVTVGREQLASDAETSVHEVSRAMLELTRIGALIREQQGSRITYYVNPSVGWNGGEEARREAVRSAPKLQASR